MTVLLDKLPSILAFLIGIMSIIPSGKTMRGWQPGWKVIAWLPVYNFVMGIWSLIPAVLLWIHHPYALIASLVTLGIHVVVLLLLLTVFHSKVAMQSIRAMSFRVIAWIGILALLWLQR
ncbi:MAG: hypothetical protein ABI904_22960 [Chloroflexota bacterium]